MWLIFVVNVVCIFGIIVCFDYYANSKIIKTKEIYERHIDNLNKINNDAIEKIRIRYEDLIEKIQQNHETRIEKTKEIYENYIAEIKQNIRDYFGQQSKNFIDSKPNSKKIMN